MKHTLVAFLLILNSSSARTPEHTAAVYVSGNHPAEIFNTLPDGADADAQFRAGLMYEKGNGVVQDYAEARKRYLLAAEQGLAAAQYRLALLYDFGWGLPQDFLEAAKWFRLAADQGNADAQTSLGLMYERGQGVQQDQAEAVRLYKLAADQGNVTAQYIMSEKHRTGQGVPQDDTGACMWHILASAQGKKSALDEGHCRNLSEEELARAQKLAREWKPRPQGHP